MFRNFRVALLVALSALSAYPQSASANNPPLTAADVRKIINDNNAIWSKARLAYDRATAEKMLAPDFFVVLPDRKHTRQEFLDMVAHKPAAGGLTRFEPIILTVASSGDAWAAIIEEKLEFERPNAEGKLEKGYALWVTRDTWKKIGDQWQALSSEAISNERWQGAAPPIANW
jgi:Domain of unknown function (DUF4440)